MPGKADSFATLDDSGFLGLEPKAWWFRTTGLERGDKAQCLDLDHTAKWMILPSSKACKCLRQKMKNKPNLSKPPI